MRTRSLSVVRRPRRRPLPALRAVGLSIVVAVTLGLGGAPATAAGDTTPPVARLTNVNPATPAAGQRPWLTVTVTDDTAVDADTEIFVQARGSDGQMQDAPLDRVAASQTEAVYRGQLNAVTTGTWTVSGYVTDAAGNPALITDTSGTTGSTATFPVAVETALQLPAGSGLSLSARPMNGATALVDHQVLLSGYLTLPAGSPLGDYPVVVWTRPAGGGAYTRADLSHTDSRGYWSAVISPSAALSVLARVGGNITGGPVRVIPHAEIWRNRPGGPIPTTRNPVIMRGTFAPARRKVPIQLWRRDSGHWRKVAAAETDRYGKWSISRTLPLGKARYRLTSPPLPYVAAGRDTFTLTVKRPRTATGAVRQSPVASFPVPEARITDHLCWPPLTLENSQNEARAVEINVTYTLLGTTPARVTSTRTDFWIDRVIWQPAGRRIFLTKTIEATWWDEIDIGGDLIEMLDSAGHPHLVRMPSMWVRPGSC